MPNLNEQSDDELKDFLEGDYDGEVIAAGFSNLPFYMNPGQSYS